MALIDELSNILSRLALESNNSAEKKMSKKYCQENITCFAKMKSNKTLSKAAPLSSTSLKTYCLRWKKHTINRLSINHVMHNKVARNLSHCAECWSEKSQFMKQKHKK